MQRVSAKSEISLLAIARAYSALQLNESRGSKEITCLCPSPEHHDTHPSCNINETKGVWYCHGCQRGGDVFDFIRAIHSCDFPEAIKILRDKHEIIVGNFTSNSSTDTSHLRKVLEWAIASFHLAIKGRGPLVEPLLEVTEKTATEYLSERGFDLGDITLWNLGYSPSNTRALAQAYHDYSWIREEDLLELGLLTRNKKGNLFDTFHGRLIIPIKDSSGQPVGIVGRKIIKGNSQKYINSKENALFSKRKTVLNIDHVKSGNDLIIVEGPLDVFRMVKLGFHNTVATMGTALTTEQIQIITKRSTRVVLFGDGDQAGRDATYKRGALLLQAGASVYVIDTRDGEDPDSLGHTQPALVADMVSHRMSLFKYIINQRNTTDWQTKADVFIELRDIIRQSPEERRPFLLEELSETLGIAEPDLPNSPQTLKPKKQLTEPTEPIQVPRILMDLVYVITQRTQSPELAELSMTLVPEIMQILPAKLSKLLLRAMEVAEGSILIGNTWCDKVIIQSSALNGKSTNVDWPRFMLTLGQWIATERINQEVIRLKDLMSQRPDLSIDIFGKIIAEKRKELKK